MSEHGVPHRCGRRSVDGPYPQGADALVLSWILHDWSDARCGTILRNCFDALPRGGILLISEIAWREHGEPRRFGNIMNMHMLIACGSMSNGNQHDHDPLPVLVAGGASGQLRGDRHLSFPAHTPMANLMLSLLDKLGVHQDSFGDSTGKLEI